MTKSRKNILMNSTLSIAMFFMLFMSFFFYRAHIDNYIFYSFTDFDFRSMIEYCLHYGNGRLLGNIICTIMSHLFYASPIFVSASLLAIILLLNKIIFNSNYKTLLIIFIAFFALEFSTDEQVYSYSPMFINYVLPFLFYLISLFCFEATNRIAGYVTRAFCGFLMCIFAFSSTLFSENTAVLFLVSSFALLVYCYKKTKKVSLVGSFLSGAVLLGVAVLFLLPYLFGVEGLLKWYKGTVSFDLKSIIIQAAQLSKYIFEFSLLLLVISLTVCLYLFFVAEKKVNICLILIIVAVPLFSVTAIGGNESLDNILVRLLLLIVLMGFAITIIVALVVYIRREHKPMMFMFFVIVALNFGMCLFVEPIGIRVLFASYFFAVVWLLYSFKLAYPKINERIKIPHKPVLNVLVAISVAFSSFVFLENADLFSEHIYKVADESIKETIDLEDSGVNIDKYLFILKNRKLSHPKYLEDIVMNDTVFMDHIDSFDH